MGDYRIPIPARRKVTVTIEELDNRVVTLRPVTARILKLTEALLKHPEDASPLVDIVEALVGGQQGLTRDEIEDLSFETLHQLIVVAKMPLEELEAAAKKDAAAGTA